MDGKLTLLRHAAVHDRTCMTVLSSTIQQISRTHMASNRARHGQCIEQAALRQSYRELETMGTELLTVGVSVLLFGLCAFFVRICDRI